MKSTLKALALSAAMAVGAATASFAEERPITDAVIVEYLEFNLVEGSNPDEFLRETLAMDDVLEGYDGFVARHLARNTDGSWVEVVYWTSLETAEAALPVLSKIRAPRASWRWSMGFAVGEIFQRL